MPRYDLELWDAKIASKLEPLLEGLLACEPVRVDGDLDAVPNSHGVYLFSSETGEEYVGRTGLTERSRRAGKSGSSGFRARLKSHLKPRHNAGTFAYRRAHKAMSFPEGTRQELVADPEFMDAFKTEIEAVRQMEFRWIEIPEDSLAAVFEVFAATVLETPWNSFSTS